MNISREMEQDTQRYIEEAHLVFQFGAASIILRCGLVHLHRIHSIVDGSTKKKNSKDEEEIIKNKTGSERAF